MRRSHLAVLLPALAICACPAQAHPHVWVSARAELVYEPGGKIAAVRQHWTFDEGYSAVAVQGLDANGDGQTSPDELAELARLNTSSLVEYGYFTFLKANGAKQVFAAPRGESMSYVNGRLILRFELPLAAAAAGRTVVLDTFDPSFFVDFQTAPGDDAVTLAGAPAGCSLRISRPKPQDGADAKPESVFQGLSGASGFASSFASRAMAVCP